MKTPNKIFGFRWKEVNDERMPDCPRIIRFAMHCFWKLAFRALPMRWMYCEGIRRRAWEAVVERFGWWGASHKNP